MRRDRDGGALPVRPSAAEAGVGGGAETPLRGGGGGDGFGVASAGAVASWPLGLRVSSFFFVEEPRNIFPNHESDESDVCGAGVSAASLPTICRAAAAARPPA